MKRMKKFLSMAMAVVMVLGMATMFGTTEAKAADKKVTVYVQPGSDWSGAVYLNMWGDATNNLGANVDITAWGETKSFPKMNDTGKGWWSVEITNPSSLGGFQFVTDGGTSDKGIWEFNSGDWLDNVKNANDGDSIWFSKLKDTCTTEAPEGWNTDDSSATEAPKTTETPKASEAPKKDDTKKDEAKPTASTDAKTITDDKTPSANNDDVTPKTADMAPLALVAALGMISAAGLIIVRKRNVA